AIRTARPKNEVRSAPCPCHEPPRPPRDSDAPAVGYAVPIDAGAGPCLPVPIPCDDWRHECDAATDNSPASALRLPADAPGAWHIHSGPISGTGGKPEYPQSREHRSQSPVHHAITAGPSHAAWYSSSARQDVAPRAQRRGTAWAE